MTHTAYIYDAVRTPRSKGKAGGSLYEVKPVDLGAGLLRALQARHDLDTSYVDDVVMGCVTPVGEQGSDIAKMIVQNADWDESVAGVQLDRFCASGLEAVNIAAQKVASGWEDLVVAGGVECMSRVPMGSNGGAMGGDPAFSLKSGFVPQGIGADTIATLEGWSREDVDAFALESQRRAAHARDSGYFDRSVIPVLDRNGLTILERDDFIKPDTTLEGLAGLKPSFLMPGQLGFDDVILAKYPTLDKINHVHTPGNSSGIVDGSSAVLIGSEKAGKDLGLTPRGRIVATAVLSTDPIIMLTGPGPAAKKCLQKAGLQASDIDLWEINEAFASVALRYMKDLDIDHSVTNVNGGAIAVGHPLGATGGMLVSVMLDELERRGLKRAMLSLCVGGGMGISTIIERVQRNQVTMSVFKYEKDADGIVTVTMDMTGPVNAMNEEYRVAMDETLARLEGEQGLTGVVIASAEKVFFAGGDLNDLLAAKPGDESAFMAEGERVKSGLRRLEKLPVPVVAAINGAALGGGFELALACNYRLAWNDRSVQLGLPEVSLGLLPGGGGVVRMVNLLGLEKALPYLLEGTRIDPGAASAAGLVHELVESPEALVPAAKAWIKAQQGNADAAVQPWDRKGFRIPGGNASSPQVAQLITIAPAMLRKKTRGLMPAPEVILDCAVEAARLDFDTAQKVESRGLTWLAMTPVAKNMISTFFFAMNRINRGGSRPQGVAPQSVTKVGVLGAGMMGQGIAYVSAMAGIQVVLKDISVTAAEKGKAYSEALLAKRVQRGAMSEETKQQVLDLILATASNDDLAGCDLIIEAVFENMGLKHQITRELEGQLAPGGVWGSNTSTLPITQLAEGSSKPENFIGIHFFSPVDKMPLVEIICGEQTSETTLAKAYDYARQIKKTPIVVNDSLGFFTSRTFGTYLDEGVRMVQEGLHPVLVENMGKAVGMPVGPLAVYDEVSLELTMKAQATWKEMGVLDKFGDGSITRGVISTLVEEHGRGGRYHGGGFYEYAADGGKSIWPGLLDLYYQSGVTVPEQDMRDRLLFRQVIESLRCLESGVLRTVDDGNIGSIMGIGAPPWTGGFIQFVNTYGVDRFVARCEDPASRYGDRFDPPAIAREKLAAGELFG